MELGEGNKIRVTRASIGFTQASGLEMGVNAMSMFAGAQSTELEDSRVLQLLNMVTAEDLIDNEDYEGMMAHCSHLVHGLLTTSRNLRRRYGRMPKVWQDSRDEDPSSVRRKPTICWCGQDLFEVRGLSLSKEGT